MSFNQNLLERQMTNKELYRKLSRKGMDVPDEAKHQVLSEENIEQLLRKSEPLEPQ